MTNFGAGWYVLGAAGRTIEPSQQSGGGYGGGGGGYGSGGGGYGSGGW